MEENESFDLIDGESRDFVPAVFARSIEEAEKYRELLNDHDIPAVMGDEEEEDDSTRRPRRRGMTRGVPVLVPEALLDEASEIIADREQLEEYEISDDEFDNEEDEDETFALSSDLDLDEEEDLEEEDEFFDEEDFEEDADELDEEEF